MRYRGGVRCGDGLNEFCVGQRKQKGAIRRNKSASGGGRERNKSAAGPVRVLPQGGDGGGRREKRGQAGLWGCGRGPMTPPARLVGVAALGVTQATDAQFPSGGADLEVAGQSWTKIRISSQPSPASAMTSPMLRLGKRRCRSWKPGMVWRWSLRSAGTTVFLCVAGGGGGGGGRGLVGAGVEWVEFSRLTYCGIPRPCN